MSRKLATTLVFLITCVCVSQTWAGLIITLNDNGLGKTYGTMVGNLDLSSGVIVGGFDSPRDSFGSSGQPLSPRQLIWNRSTAGPGVNKRVTLDGDAGNQNQMDFWDTVSSEVSSQLQVQDFSISFVSANQLGNGRVQLFGWNGSEDFSLNESFTYDSIPFANFNHGTWNFGGGAESGGVTIEIGQAVPEPSSAIIFAVGLSIGLVHRRRTRITTT